MQASIEPAKAPRRHGRGPARSRAPRALDALGDRHRRSILEILGHGPLSVGDIAERLPISRPAVSRHLRLLKEARLVTVRVEATRHIFELNAAGAREVQAYLSRLWGLVGARFTLYANNRGRGDKAGTGASPKTPPRDTPRSERKDHSR
ncbi:MAG: winged helix-turn-helix transcriptional regulator [Candidatus Eisenbacteria bacterium]|nr:winged helix-turn-helix transcriptional regulator [Candidatus Eisenbacteria bacterium]